MQNIDKHKLKLEQKKNRLLTEETKLKIKERKMRTRKLIELGGLVIKAELDHLPSNTLYGGLLSLKQSIETDANSNLQTSNISSLKSILAEFKHGLQIIA